MRPGVSGFVAKDIDQMVAAVHKIDSISREQCCRYFEERLTVEKMIDKYEQVDGCLVGPQEMRRPIFFDQAAAAR